MNWELLTGEPMQSLVPQLVQARTGDLNSLLSLVELYFEGIFVDEDIAYARSLIHYLESREDSEKILPLLEEIRNDFASEFQSSVEIKKIEDISRLTLPLHPDIRTKIMEEILARLIFEVRKDGKIDAEEKQVFQRMFTLLKISKDRYDIINEIVIGKLETDPSKGEFQKEPFLSWMREFLEYFYTPSDASKIILKVGSTLG